MKMGKIIDRVPLDYDGNIPTGRPINKMLEALKLAFEANLKLDPFRVVEAFATLISKEQEPYVTPKSFIDGVLLVIVKNPLINSLLTREKQKLLAQLQEQFPDLGVKSIMLKMG